MSRTFLSLILLTISSLSSLLIFSTSAEDKTKSYIIHVHPPLPTQTTNSWHLSFFPQNSPSPNILYSYNNAINGFAARLSESELKIMRNKPGFLYSTEDFLVPLATTHTPKFLGLLNSGGKVKKSGIWNKSDFGRGVIVAVFDTGVLPNHPSFDERGISPPPPKWKGKCEFSGMACNNKLIGARAFLQGAQAMGNDISNPTSPLDTNGHGTHTASTAVGNFVVNVSALGQAAGTAVGMAPNAHLAVYKVCTENGCAESDILAAIDAAIEEGADILSMSLGDAPKTFDIDSIAIGTFAAMEKGIFVSLAAGNDGPGPSTVSNEAPWILTVGASTMDRVIQTNVKLGNGEEFEGQSLYQTDSIEGELLPLVYPGKSGNVAEKFCLNNSFKIDVKGKIVICDRGGNISRIQQGAFVKQAGAAAMILAAVRSDGYTTVADAHVLPASHINYPSVTKIKSYLNSTNSPTATIIPQGTIIGKITSLPAPTMATFSSRGPSLHSKGILKPDIIGPGVSILAGWPALAIGPNNNYLALFNVISGTSMSTPHLSGIAALLKAVNPSWSPAAIRSAIMTSADNVNDVGKAIEDEELRDADLFAKGAGHVNPSRAQNPGFVYDIEPTEYIGYLCGLNYSDTQVTAITRRIVNCSTIEPIYDVELNYPSFSVEMRPQYSRKVFRKVKNVGEGSSRYTVEIAQPHGVAVTVSPTTLIFSKIGQELNYFVEFSRDRGDSSMNYSEGYLTWVSSDKTISVRSPISITFTSK